MMPLIITGIIFIIAGSFIMGMKLDRRLKVRTKRMPFIEKIASNIGVLFFVIGIVCLIAGVANLYYS